MNHPYPRNGYLAFNDIEGDDAFRQDCGLKVTIAQKMKVTIAQKIKA